MPAQKRTAESMKEEAVWDFGKSDDEEDQENINQPPTLRPLTDAELMGEVERPFLSLPEAPSDPVDRAIYALHRAMYDTKAEAKTRILGHSDKTSGMIMPRQMHAWMRALNLPKKAYVSDLGSGFGNIVFLLAAFAPQARRVVGIELSEKCTRIMKEFVDMCEEIYTKNGFPLANYQLLEGSFTSDDHIKHFQRTDVFFLNNAVFREELMQELITRFYSVAKHGAVIISVKPLAPIDVGAALEEDGEREFSDKVFRDPLGRIVAASFLDVEKMPVVGGQNTSWKANNQTFYRNVVNRYRMEAFRMVFKIDVNNNRPKRGKIEKGRRVSEMEVYAAMKKVEEGTKAAN